MTNQPQNEENRRKFRILVAEDEENTRRATVRILQLSGYDVQGVSNGAKAIQKLCDNDFDLLLLDIRMPDMDGVEVMRRLEKTGRSIPIIILTAYASLESAITAVKAGAVDYLVKPQQMQEILAAVEKALLKSQTNHDKQVLNQMLRETLALLRSQNLETDIVSQDVDVIQEKRKLCLEFREQRAVLVNKETQIEKIVELTTQQASILQYLMDAKGKVCSCMQIAQQALDYPPMTEKEGCGLVRPHILRLRQKLEDDPVHPQVIQTVRGRGYRYLP